MSSVTQPAAPVKIGTSGWSYPDWKGVFYPRERPRGFDELAYLANYFHAVEVNNTFYRPPRAEDVADWVRRVRRHEGFEFTFKLHQRFTHQRNEPWTPQEAEPFKAGLVPAVEAGMLGGLLAQFPWSFRAADAAKRHLKALAEEFRHYPLILEVRHVSWLEKSALQTVADLGLGWCNIDQPQLPGNIGAADLITSPIAYVRLHGRNREAWFPRARSPRGRGGQTDRSDAIESPQSREGRQQRRGRTADRDARYNYLYNNEELDEWLMRIQNLARRCEKLFVFFNNHFRSQAPANALQMAAKVRGAKIPVPPAMLEAFDFLAPIAAPEPPGPGRQQHLFK